MIMILFTKSKRIGSRLICWVTDEPVSHVAVMPVDGVVAHMSFSGYKLELLEEFKETHDLVYYNAVEFDRYEALAIISKLRKKGLRFYDYPAILYLGTIKLVNKLLGTNFPINRNKLQTRGFMMCTEFATQLLQGSENSVITPYELYKELMDGNLRPNLRAREVPVEDGGADVQEPEV